MVSNWLQEYRQFRRSILGRARLMVSLASMATGIFFWIRDQNPILAIPLAVLSPLFLYIPGLFYRLCHWLHDHYRLGALKMYEFSFIGIIILSGTGSTYLFYKPFQFDILVHFLENFTFSFLLVFTLNIIREKRGKPSFNKKQACIRIPIWGLIMGFGWEVYQYSCDEVLGSKMVWDSMQTRMHDSMTDMIGGSAGLILGTLLIGWKHWEGILKTLQRNKNAHS